jgi:hypothetical protein
MNGKLTVLVISIFLPVFISGFILFQVPPDPKKYNLAITKVDNIWKVVDGTDHSKTKIKVKKKDTIIWKANGTDAYLQFPDKLFSPVDDEDNLNNGYTKFLKDGKRLKLKVKDDVLSGTYEYAVFCTADGVFASGDSPPRIVIE